MGIIEELYAEVVDGMRYDYEIAQWDIKRMTDEEVKTKDLPEIVAYFIKENKVGCCLHFAMALYYKMQQAGIECYILTTEENLFDVNRTDNYVSVLYQNKEGWFIANPVATVKGSTENNLAIPEKEFVKKHKVSKLYVPYGMYRDLLFFKDFVDKPFGIFEGVLFSDSLFL